MLVKSFRSNRRALAARRAATGPSWAKIVGTCITVDGITLCGSGDPHSFVYVTGFSKPAACLWARRDNTGSQNYPRPDPQIGWNP